MIRVVPRDGETVQLLVGRFKKTCIKEGLIKEIKRTARYEKPSEIRNRQKRRSPVPEKQSKNEW